MRAMALAKCAAEKNRSRQITLVGNETAICKIERFRSSENIKLIALDDRLRKQDFCQQVQRVLSKIRFSKLIVDTFPRGIVGELIPTLTRTRVPTVFVHRDIVPEYIKKDLVKRVVERFELVLVPGEPAPLSNLRTAVLTDPWVLLDSKDLLSLEAARAVMSCRNQSNPVCLVSLSSKPSERQVFSRIACDLVKRCGNQSEVVVCGDMPSEFKTQLRDHWIDYWPAMKLLAGVDFLVGAGGYNTYYESALSNTELFALPQNRLYDRQKKRVKSNSYSSAAELVTALSRRLNDWPCNSKESPPIEYLNGVHRAVEEIEGL